MTTFFTADTHFCHKNVISYCNRPFTSVEEMNERLISNWNEVVSNKDIIYHLGDFIFSSRKRVLEIASRLNGNIIFIIGSHDNPNHLRQITKQVFDSKLIKINSQNIFLSHYCHKVWPKSHYGTWHLIGHSHGGLNNYTRKEGKILDVGVDTHNFYPWSLKEVEEIMKSRPDNFNLVRG